MACARLKRTVLGIQTGQGEAYQQMFKVLVQQFKTCVRFFLSMKYIRMVIYD